MDLNNLKYKLEVNAELEGTEIGEYWQLMANLSSYTDSMSDDFQEAFLKELERISTEIDEEYEIIEEEYQPPVQKYKTLRWKYE